MQKTRLHVRRRLGSEKEQQLFIDFGDDMDSYIHNFLLIKFNNTNEAGICKFCNQKTVFVHLSQDRSGDEGMTAHAICNNTKCRRKWIMY